MTSTKHMLDVMGYSKKVEDDSTVFDTNVDLPQLDEPQLTHSAQPSLGNVLAHCLNSTPNSKPTPKS